MGYWNIAIMQTWKNDRFKLIIKLVHWVVGLLCKTFCAWDSFVVLLSYCVLVVEGN